MQSIKENSLREDGIKMIKVAVVQSASVLFDREATIQKANRLIEEAGKAGAKLVLLPEAYIPAYPRGLGFVYLSIIGTAAFMRRIEKATPSG